MSHIDKDALNQKYQQADINNRSIAAYRPLPPETLRSLREYYRVGLTYTSNAIEGNSLTESETKVVIEDGLTIEGKPLREIYEAVGHAHAYDYLHELVGKERLVEEDVLTLHRLFYQQIDPARAGTYRTVKVFISGSSYAVSPVTRIADDMRKLIEWYNRNEQRLHPIELAAVLHMRFVFIHPFIDGNGRVARLVMNLALLRRGFTIALIPALLRHEYVRTLEAAHTDPLLFLDFIADRVIATQSDLLRMFRSQDDTVNDTVNDTVKVCSGKPESQRAALTMNEQLVLDTVRSFPTSTYEQLAARCLLSRPTIARTLKELQARALIRRVGSDKAGHWEVVEQ